MHKKKFLAQLLLPLKPEYFFYSILFYLISVYLHSLLHSIFYLFCVISKNDFFFFFGNF